MTKLVVVSGPSGVGKTTVCDHLLRRPEFERVVTATTRSARGDERQGVDYVFLSEAEFDGWIEQQRFLEWARVHDHRYGSPRAAAQEILEARRHALLNIDVQGAAAIRASGVPSLLVFLLAPSWDQLEKRLRGRRTDAPEAVERRLATARTELARQDEFDLRVVNDDSRRAAEEIVKALS